MGVWCLNQLLMFALEACVQSGLNSIMYDCYISLFHRFKHQALFNRICRQLLRIPSLGLGRGVRCGQKIHGRLVTSFTVQKSFVKRIRVSELHLTAFSLMDALLTSSLPCARSLMCLPLQLSVTHVIVLKMIVYFLHVMGLSLLSPQSRPSTFCHALLRRAACIGMWLSEAVVKPYVFLRGLLLLAGDVERNPGPLQGRRRAGSCQHSCWMC